LIPLDSDEIKKIAWLARLVLDENKIADYQRELGNVLNLVEQMNSVDTANIEPLAQPQEIYARLRQDKVTEDNQRDKFQKIAPEVENGHYLVPKVIE